MILEVERARWDKKPLARPETAHYAFIDQAQAELAFQDVEANVVFVTMRFCSAGAVSLGRGGETFIADLRYGLRFGGSISLHQLDRHS